MSLSKEELKRIRRSLDGGITPGPWRPMREPDVSNDYFERHTEDKSTPIESVGTNFALGVAVGVASSKSDAEFICNARTWVPILLAEVERLHGERDKFKKDMAAELDRLRAALCRM